VEQPRFRVLINQLLQAFKISGLGPTRLSQQYETHSLILPPQSSMLHGSWLKAPLFLPYPTQASFMARRSVISKFNSVRLPV